MRRKIYSKKIFVCIICIGFISFENKKKWGFQGHKIINRMAIFTLPSEMSPFFKKNIEYITEHSTTPDSRRYTNKKEGAGHYIDMEFYSSIIDLQNLSWKKITSIVQEDSLYKHGVLPWRIIQYKYLLQNAFENKSYKDIIKFASELGHYIADAHVPLHTTKNYNGQLTNQHGIHSLWETKIVNILVNDLNYFTKKAQYIDNLQPFIWEIIINSNSDVNTVLRTEEILNSEQSFPKYSFPTKNEKKTYSDTYIKEYNKKLNGMVENRIKLAIQNLGSIWYTAWIDAGQPILKEEKIIKSFLIRSKEIHECE
jgi:hypothetical protein